MKDHTFITPLEYFLDMAPRTKMVDMIREQQDELLALRSLAADVAEYFSDASTLGQRARVALGRDK